ncbi:MAG: hypothetical protein IKU76_04530 [Bacteroidaceae bacterium]|nr:hypothetical protein [Bacteroidaceae bacterium]MBR5860682.1 hypothetical protein [Bacteroidaceae bacterium]
MATILKNIYKVEFIESRFLKDITVVPGKGVFLNMWRNFQLMDTVGLSSATSTSKIVKKNTIYNIKMTAFLKEQFLLTNKHLCYRLTTVMGEKYLLGTERAPYPITTTSDNFPSVVTEKSGTTLTVEYSNTLGLLPILD